MSQVLKNLCSLFDFVSSFDMIQNASETSDFPHCVSLIMGSQTTHSRDNALSLIKLKNIQRQKQKSNDEMETESSTSDSEVNNRFLLMKKTEV